MVLAALLSGCGGYPKAAGRSSTTAPRPRTTAPAPASAVAAPLPAVASCAGPRTPPVLRPTTIYVGCATGDETVTGITWGSWAPSGASGTGTVNLPSGRYPGSQVSLSSPVEMDGSLVFGEFTVTLPSGSAGRPISSDGDEGSGWGAG